MTSIQLEKKRINQPAWYRPIFSPEHGVYVVLVGSFLTGAALAQAWTFSTTLALIVAFFSFQAEYPWQLQLKQRKSFKPHCWVWGGLYGTIAAGIALWLVLRMPVLLWIYTVAIAALVVDSVEVLRKERKSIANELITFAAVSLSAPFAYVATTGTLSAMALGVWGLNAFYFSSSIFTVKLRKSQTSSLVPGIIYHAIATLTIAVLYYFGWFNLVTALAFGVALLKFGAIAWQQQWYRSAKIQTVATLETLSAFLFVAIAAISVLPALLVTGH
jgi:hypothetical protein